MLAVIGDFPEQVFVSVHYLNAFPGAETLTLYRA